VGESFAVCGSRFALPGSRFPVRGSRFAFSRVNQNKIEKTKKGLAQPRQNVFFRGSERRDGCVFRCNPKKTSKLHKK